MPESTTELPFFEQFLEFAPDAMLGVGRDGLIALVNKQTEELFRYRREELLGKPIEMLIPERYRAGHVRLRSGYFDDPRTRPMGAGIELYGLRKDGSEFPAEISLSHIRTGGELLATAAVRDVTEQMESQRERQALKSQLQQARAARLESIGQLAGGIAHDFNNLLSVILNYADFAVEELEDRPEIRRDVDEIRHAARKAADLTRQLLVFSRREVVSPEPLDLNAVVGEMENLLKRTLGSHIELETRLPPDLSTVLADPGALEQILVNLAVNARDAMEGGGHLRIRTAEVELDELFTESHPEVTPGYYVELTVEDSGSGMSPEIASRAFDPFFTTKPKGQGTGLGLATVYGIARQAGGTATIYTEGGSGTAIRVYLPSTSERPAVAAAAADAAGPVGARGETILVVEDEEAVRRVAIRLLTDAGYSVLEASGGQQAMRLCRESPSHVDLLLTDVIMPGMLGTEVAEHLRALRPGLRVLYMSGYMEAVGSPSVRADLVEKPFSRRSLLERVRHTLDRPSSE